MSVVVMVLLYIVDLPWLTRTQQIPLAITIAIIVFSLCVASSMKYYDSKDKQASVPLICSYATTSFSLVLLLTSENQESPLPSLVCVLAVMTFFTTLVKFICIDD